MEDNTNNEESIIFRQWAANYNLKNILFFHNTVCSLLKNELDLIPKELKDNSNEKLNYKLYEQDIYNYDDYLTINTFLMLFSYAEEWFYILANKPDSNNEREGILKRFEKPLKEKGLNTDSSAWKELLKSEEIRNCLLHANGRISFIKNGKKDHFKQILRSNKYFKEKHDRLYLNKEYISFIVKNIETAINQIK